MIVDDVWPKLSPIVEKWDVDEDSLLSDELWLEAELSLRVETLDAPAIPKMNNFYVSIILLK